MAWTHKSLERSPEYSVDDRRVLKGSTVIAWIRGRRGRLEVFAVGGPIVGVASTLAEAMLMAARHEEAPRCRR